MITIYFIIMEKIIYKTFEINNLLYNSFHICGVIYTAGHNFSLITIVENTITL